MLSAVVIGKDKLRQCMKKAVTNSRLGESNTSQEEVILKLSRLTSMKENNKQSMCGVFQQLQVFRKMVSYNQNYGQKRNEEAGSGFGT